MHESHRFLFEPANIRQAVAHHGTFQVFDMDEALKIDFYPRELIPGELERSEMLEVFTGVSLLIVSKVDAVGSKLNWISKGSHKSRRDVRRIYRRASADECQQIRQLSEQLRPQDLLDKVLNEPDEIENS